MTNPIPNSTAESTRKKKVKDKKLTLSYRKPRLKDRTYNVIHSISAVNNRWSAVFTLITIVANIMKNTIENRLISPIYII
jgi:hypothetical protein